MLNKWGWIKGDWDPQHDAIKADLAKLEIAESVSMTAEECKRKADDDKSKFFR